MEERVQLLDIAVDIVSTEGAANQTKQYLEEEDSHVVYLVNSETLLLLQKEQEAKSLVEQSDLILPGNASVNMSIDRVLGRKRESFFLESYMENVLDYSIEMGHELLIVTESESKFTLLQETMHEKHPYITISGLYMTEQDETLENLVNGINSVAPELLLIALREEQQLMLLKEFRNQMNAGLMLFTGNNLYNHAVSEADVPESIQKLKIENLYKWFRVDGRLRTFWSNLRMKLRLNQVDRTKKNDSSETEK